MRVSLRTSVALFDRRHTDGNREMPSPALGRFEILDLSIRGALVEGDIGVPVGTPVGVHLQLSGTQVQVASVVVRRDQSPAGMSCALSFEVVPDRDNESLQKAVDAVLQELERRSQPR